MSNITFTDAQGKPLADAFAELHPLEILSDSRCDEIKTKLLASRGDYDAAGVTPRDTRNLIYTLRMKAKPLSENTEAGVAKATRSKAGKETVPLIDVNSAFE